MSQLEMALGGLTHSTQPPDNCWSSTAWEHQNLTDSGSVEGGGGGGGGGGGEYSSSRIDWDLRTPWEWDNENTMTTVYPGRHGDGGSAAGSQQQHHHQQHQTSNEWANGACSAVTLATSSMDFSIGLASGGSSASGISVSSGIPGLAASRGSSGADLSSLVKSEPDEINNGMDQHQHQQQTTVLGTPATSSALEHQHQRRLFISLGGGSDRESEVLERRCEEPKPSELAQQSNGGGSASVAGGGGADSLNMGLKLGRRTYFEDSATGGGPGGGGQVTKGSTPSLSPPGKKQRTVSTPSTQIARCQVEGCKADLSSCKDYHRRHKVCEMHSKAPRAMAAGIEQRFCQQCSRFHVLTEFDEEKRSCRRRLAGHNERRRKPHVDTHHHGIGLRSPSPHHSDTSSLGLDDSKRSRFLSQNRSFEDDDHYTSSLKHPHPWSLERRDNGGLPSQLQIQNTERQQQQSIFSGGRPATADRLLMLLQSPKTQMAAPNPSTTGLAMGGGHHHFLERPLGPLGQGLSLSSSTGGVFGSLEPPPPPPPPPPQQHHHHHHRGVVGSCSQSLSSVSGLSHEPGRALSLLSTQSWATCPPPRAPAPPLVAPLDLPPQPANSTLEQLVAGSSEHSNRGPSPFSHHHLQLPPGGPSSTSNHHHQQQQQSYDKLFRMQSGGGLNNSMGLNCGNDQIRGANNNNTNNNNYLAGLGGYEGANSMIAMLQAGHEYQPLSSGPASNHHRARPTIDLMQMPSAHQVPPHNGPHSHAQVPSGQYNEFTPLRPFESSIFSTQQML